MSTEVNYVRTSQLISCKKKQSFKNDVVIFYLNNLVD